MKIDNFSCAWHTKIMFGFPLAKLAVRAFSCWLKRHQWLPSLTTLLSKRRGRGFGKQQQNGKALSWQS
ncbi:MAG: hypothetical protein JO125_04745 [Chloroflexi bacterium]|nr:hypothetical protein [Chloroflexota bacterium]